MARLTWQNVAAADYGDALSATTAAASSFQSGLEGLASAVGGIDSRRKNALNMAAMDRLLAQRDVGAWDQALQNGGGLSALGVSASDASADLINAIAGHRDRLTGDRKTDYDFTRGMTEDAQQDTIHAEGRIDWQEGQEQEAYDRDRSRRDDARTDEAYDIDKAMLHKVSGMAPQTFSKEELTLQVTNDPTLSPEQRRAALAQVEQTPTAHWALEPSINHDGTQVGANLSSAAQLIEREQTYRNNLRQNTPGLALLDRAKTLKATYGENPMLGVIEKMGLTTKEDENGNRISGHDYDPGEAMDAFHKLQSEFQNVPAELVAVAMQDAVGSSGWTAWGNSELSFSLDRARKMLGQFNSVEAIENLYAQDQDLKSKDAFYTSQQAALDKASSKLLLMRSRGNADPAEIAKVEQEIAERLANIQQHPATRPIHGKDPLGVK